MLKLTLKSLGIPAVKGEEDLVNLVMETPLNYPTFALLSKRCDFIGVTEQFKDVMALFPSDDYQTPPGFRREITVDGDKVARVDLVRDIAYDANSVKRPTNVLFSADSANPYEVKPISPLLANLTCNPGIVYDLFINNPQANVGNLFKTRDEVMIELARILGPGVDVSVELNNPFEEDYNKILEECEKFREIFSKYRLVIKVPHTGAVTPENVNQLLEGDKTLDLSYKSPSTAGALRGHNLALRLTKEEGYRINFTLMFEPYQTQLALLARPYFINTFLRHRKMQSETMKLALDKFDSTGNTSSLDELRDFMTKNDYYTKLEASKISAEQVAKNARHILKYRKFDEAEGADGLDGMRHNLRMLRNCNLAESKLIVCSMEGDDNYPDIDKLLAEPEFLDMHDRVIITAEPNYLARFTSTNQVTSYQRRFMNAAQGEK